MGELGDHLIDNRICPNRAAYRDNLDIGGIGLDEMIFVKALQFIAACAPGHRRDMVDAGVGHHGLRRGIYIARQELRAKMLVPDRDQIVIRHCFLLSIHTASCLARCRNDERINGPRPCAGCHGFVIDCWRSRRADLDHVTTGLPPRTEVASHTFPQSFSTLSLE
jgi:hypothetical protein